MNKEYRPKEIESQHYARWEAAGYFAPSGSRRPLLHRDSAAQCHGHAAHGARAPRHDHGCAHALSPDARPQGVVATRHRPCRHRDPDGGREAAESRRHEPYGARAREVSRTRVGVEGALGQHDLAANAPPRGVGRLVPRRVHDGPRTIARGDRSIRAAPRRGIDLPRQTPSELGSGVAHGPLGPRGAEHRGTRQAVAPALPRPGRRRARRRNHAPRDDARRHGRRRASRRRTLSPFDRQDHRAAAHGPADPDHRRRVRRSRVRHRLREDHAGARLQRLRGRPSPQPAADQRVRRQRRAQRQRADPLPRPRSRSRPASAWSQTSTPRACSRASPSIRR